MKVVFFGTPQFAANVLSYLIDHKVNIVAVITKPDKPKGRSGALLPTPVKQVALEHNLPLFQPSIVSDLEFAPTLASYQADLFVVVAYGEIIKQHLLDMPKKGCINLHASILPKYRGAAPIQWSIINGEPETGITIMHMAKKMDAGDIIQINRVPIASDMNFLELEKQLCKAGCLALFDVIHMFENGSVIGTPQNHSLATFAPKIELENCRIDWKRPAWDIHNLIRGVMPEPGAWCLVDVKGKSYRLKIYSSKVENATALPGTILEYGKNGIVVGCGEGALRLVEIQLEGKKAMTSEAFARGVSKEALKLVESC